LLFVGKRVNNFTHLVMILNIPMFDKHVSI